MEIEPGSDDICKPCRHNVGGFCDDTIDTSFRPEAPSAKMEWNLLIDQRWCKRLMIGQGDRMSARALAQKNFLNMGYIKTIYCEIPAERTTVKSVQLAKGLKYYLYEENDFE